MLISTGGKVKLPTDGNGEVNNQNRLEVTGKATEFVNAEYTRVDRCDTESEFV